MEMEHKRDHVKSNSVLETLLNAKATKGKSRLFGLHQNLSFYILKDTTKKVKNSLQNGGKYLQIIYMIKI